MRLRGKFSALEMYAWLMKIMNESQYDLFKNNGWCLISNIPQHSLKHDTGLMKCVGNPSLLGNKCDVWWFGHI